MKHYLFLLALLSVVSAAANTTTSTFNEGTSSSSLELINNWPLMAVAALIISSILVAIAYMIGSGFEMPELQAWAKTEAVQVITNAIIIVALFAAFALINVVILGIVTESGLDIPECGLDGQHGGVDCLKAVTNNYLSGQIYDNLESSARNVLDENVRDSAWIGRKFGINCLSVIYCAQLGLNMGFGGFYVLHADMFSIVFEHYTTLLSFMGAQKFFVNEICFKMGPAILAIGIVARSFFFTRKLGGLLMAIAVGAMFFFPGMYIFDWITLDLSLNGDGVNTQEESLCPLECKVPPPLIYSGSTTINNEDNISLMFDHEIAQQISKGVIGSAKVTNDSSPYFDQTFYSCYHDINSTECPTACRELPYPAAPECLKKNDSAPLYVAKSCAMLPSICKIARTVAEPKVEENAKCPQSCKVIPPLKSDCRSEDDPDDRDDLTKDDGCLESSYDCRLDYTNNEANGFDWRPTKQGDANVKCMMAHNCVANMDAFQSCIYLLPPTGRCNELCGGCRPECRIEGLEADPAKIPDTCKDDDGNFNADCTTICPQGCKVTMEQLNTQLSLARGNNSCMACPAERLILSNSPQLPVNYTHNDCDLGICETKYRLSIPRSACEMCIFTEEQYMYDPPINARCADLCKPSDSRPAADPTAFEKIGPSGLVGHSAVQEVSKFMIPVYLLPLFNIIATLIFIRSLSHFLGGDVEIPGISKVF